MGISTVCSYIALLVLVAAASSVITAFYMRRRELRDAHDAVLLLAIIAETGAPIDEKMLLTALNPKCRPARRQLLAEWRRDAARGDEPDDDLAADDA